MFQSYKHIKYLGKKDGKHSWEYELIDSDFGTISGVGVGVGVDHNKKHNSLFSQYEEELQKYLLLL